MDFDEPILITANGMQTKVTLIQIVGQGDGHVYLEFDGNLV